MTFDIALLGPLARDEIVVNEETTRLTGGGIWYAAFPMLTLGRKVAVVARLAKADYPHLAPLREAGATLFPVEAFETTGIRNVYSSSQETRTCSVLGCAAALLPEDLPDISADIYYIGALMRGEVPIETVRVLAQRGRVALDLQGYLRYRQGQELPTGPYADLPQLLSLVTFVKADLAEVLAATGETDPLRGARALQKAGPAEVIVTGGARFRVLAEGNYHEASFTPASLAGRTGRGDTCMGTYVAARQQGQDPATAISWAARTTMLKVTQPGPYGGPVPPEGDC
jgi:sugar/nucleoside kinase (ribokinase family)